MAYKDSDELKADERYPLGDYSFRIERSSVPGSTNDKIEAVCTQDGKNARKSIQVPSSTQIAGWYVEANETEATVYATIQKLVSEEMDSDLETLLPKPIPTTKDCNWSVPCLRPGDGTEGTLTMRVTSGDPIAVIVEQIDGRETVFIASSTPSSVESITTYIWAGREHVLNKGFGTNQQYNYKGKTVYYNNNVANSSITSYFGKGDYSLPMPIVDIGTDGFMGYWTDAWTMVYGTSVGDEYETEEILIGRFAVDIKDAGGVGPGGGTGGGWTDPEDYDEDWEEGDPTHTLYVNVTGSLSGRHNDPIEDPSYSYIPADKNTVKDYGCGGDGGHGGGGGAGASTVVVHKFSTNQANSKEVTAIARRHGYGSGGGKGGKGGDGCILVYY